MAPLMRPLDLHLRSLAAKNRKKVNGSIQLLTSLEPDIPRKASLGPVSQLMRYSVVETARKTDISLTLTSAMRRFVEPERHTNVAQLGALWNPYYTPKSRLQDMLTACLRTPAGIRGLLEADVVAGREVIKKLMFPHKASFNASIVHGVLFLEEAEEPEPVKLDYDGIHRKMGFFRACTEMYTPGWTEPRGRVRHTLHSVVARPLGGLNLLMSGSIDCVKFKYSRNPGCYMQFVTRPLRSGKYLIRPKTWKEWYIRAHLMGIRSLYLGLIDETGFLRFSRQLATRHLPEAAGSAAGAPWDPEENIHWAFRVLTALRDFCQEEADMYAVVAPQRAARAVWRVEVSPLDKETRVLVRELKPGKRDRLVPVPVIKAYEQGYP
ncbi:hypothetical protein B0H11DRAFT_238463 [Mycena galericulata]|nr:hypothetical protein B0H11DRAFT_238463 [Mycena galericulata]